MRIFVINHTQISVETASVCFWIWIADKHLRFPQTKHLQCDRIWVLLKTSWILELKFEPWVNLYWGRVSFVCMTNFSWMKNGLNQIAIHSITIQMPIAPLTRWFVIVIFMSWENCKFIVIVTLQIKKQMNEEMMKNWNL